MSDRVTDNPERPWPNHMLEVGAIVGHTTATTCRLWLRTNVKIGNFALLVFRPLGGDANRAAIKRLLQQRPLPINTLTSDLAALCQPEGQGGVDTVRVKSFAMPLKDADGNLIDTDTTCVIDLDGLTPFTDYHYALVELSPTARCLLGQRRLHNFRTLTEQQNEPFSFGFFSCHMPYKVPHKIPFFERRTKAVNEHMWDYMNASLSRHKHKGTDGNLGFIIAGGDQVYADGVDTLSIWKLLNKVMRREDDGLHPGHDTIVSWYRDIYKGYWGFAGLREVYSSFPTYMIWDDHEIGDGWGSHNITNANDPKDEMNEVLPSLAKRGLNHADGKELLQRMFTAAKQVYDEYQHSHNPARAAERGTIGEAGHVPAVPADRYDYDFTFPNGAVYVLDGRSQRDYTGPGSTILGTPQMERFEAWLASLDKDKTPFVFVVSAVPLMHLSKHIIDHAEGPLADVANITDDLRDGWEHANHRAENKQLLDALFKAADRGLKVSVLSGDVHVAAAFRMQHKTSKSTIYQLTSSAITFNLPLAAGWGMGLTVPDHGKTHDGHQFKRLARYTDSNYSLIKVNRATGIVDFQLYSEQDIINPNTNLSQPMTHSIATVELGFAPGQI